VSVHTGAGFDRPVTTATFRARKSAGQRIAMITAYDVSSARLVDAAGIDAVLVGDSLGMTVLGHPSTLQVTMDDMLRATAAVVRGTTHALVIADMPFMSYQASPEDALRNAAAFLAAGAAAVKLEGGAHMADTVRRLTEAGIPVMGHLGLTPQSVNQLGRRARPSGRRRVRDRARVHPGRARRARKRRTRHPHDRDRSRRRLRR
jgi:3-methyl-2-oxobutanoate hydroxymethyltransferase